MRFISKSSNLTVILKPSFPGNHLTGTPPISGVSAKFQSGVLEVKDEAIIDLLLKHPAYQIDFISVDETEADPFMYQRMEQEPSHVISEINYGHVEKSVGNKKPVRLSPEIRKALQEESLEMAKEMAKQMLPGMLKEAMKDLMGESIASTETTVAEVKEENTSVPSKTTKKTAKTETNVKIEDIEEEQ